MYCWAGADDEADDPGFSVSVTGHTVVYRSMTEVVTLPAGQSVTVGAHDVMVYVTVV